MSNIHSSTVTISLRPIYNWLCHWSDASSGRYYFFSWEALMYLLLAAMQVESQYDQFVFIHPNSTSSPCWSEKTYTYTLHIYIYTHVINTYCVHTHIYIYVCMYVRTAWYWQEMWRHHLSLGIRGWKGPHWSPCGSRFQNPNPQMVILNLPIFAVTWPKSECLKDYPYFETIDGEPLPCCRCPMFPGLRSTCLDRRGALPSPLGAEIQCQQLGQEVWDAESLFPSQPSALWCEPFKLNKYVNRCSPFCRPYPSLIAIVQRKIRRK